MVIPAFKLEEYNAHHGTDGRFTTKTGSKVYVPRPGSKGYRLDTNDTPLGPSPVAAKAPTGPPSTGGLPKGPAKTWTDEQKSYVYSKLKPLYAHSGKAPFRFNGTTGVVSFGVKLGSAQDAKKIAANWEKARQGSWV
jgi:hypothetical protein